MRIAYVCADLGVPVFGCKGCSIHVQEVIRALRARGATVELFAARFGGHAPSDLADVRFFQLPEPDKRSERAREQAAIAGNRVLQELLASRPPFDVVYERYSLWSYAGMVWARSAGIPGILEVNAPLVDEQAAHRTLHDRQSAERIAREAFSAARMVFAVSSGVAAYAEKLGVSADQIELVPNGVDPGRFQAGRLAAAGEPFTIGFVGTLKPWHGLSTLIAAMSAACSTGTEMRLVIVGDGPERARIEAEIAERGLSARVEMTGSVEPDRIPELLARMDVAVAPYPDMPEFYFSPLKIMEYMAAGLPVIASRIGDIDGLILDEETSLLCPPGDVKALAEALIRLYHEPTTRARLGVAARARVVDRFSWDRVALRIQSLADEPAARSSLRAGVC